MAEKRLLYGIYIKSAGKTQVIQDYILIVYKQNMFENKDKKSIIVKAFFHRKRSKMEK